MIKSSWGGQVQAFQVTGASIGELVNGIFDTLGRGNDVLKVGDNLIAGKFGELAVRLCGTLVSKGVGALTWTTICLWKM